MINCKQIREYLADLLLMVVVNLQTFTNHHEATISYTSWGWRALR